jgi:hypothetical protein
VVGYAKVDLDQLVRGRAARGCSAQGDLLRGSVPPPAHCAAALLFTVLGNKQMHVVVSLAAYTMVKFG